MTLEAVDVISRVALVLRAVSRGEPEGFSTTEVSRNAGVPRPTSHRLLSALAREGLVDRDRRTGRWRLGPELYLLGVGAARRYDATATARPVVERLSVETGESAFFSARRADETVCLLSVEGSFPLRSHVLHEGIRFPLGVASAGLAILSHLDIRDADDFLERMDLSREWSDDHGVSKVRDRIAETRKFGYAINQGLIVPGSWGIGAAVFDRDGQPAWALSLTGVESRFSADRIPYLGKTLLAAAHALTTRLADVH